MMLNNKNQNLKWNFIFIILFIIFLFSFPFFKKKISNNYLTINKSGEVLLAINNSTGFFSGFFSNLIKNLSSKKYLTSEIQRLENELNQEKQKSVDVLSMVLDKNTKVLVAKKIFSDFSTIYDTVLLNRGTQDGVLEGDIVFLYPDKAIGKIDKVSLNTSLMTLFAKDKEKVEGVFGINLNKAPVKIETTQPEGGSTLDAPDNQKEISTKEADNLSKNKPATPILLDVYGYGGGDFISRIPSNIEVSTGTIVYLAEDESKLLGEVVEIEKQDASFYKILLIRGFYNPRMGDSYFIKTLKN